MNTHYESKKFEQDYEVYSTLNNGTYHFEGYVSAPISLTYISSLSLNPQVDGKALASYLYKEWTGQDLKKTNYFTEVVCDAVLFWDGEPTEELDNLVFEIRPIDDDGSE